MSNALKNSWPIVFLVTAGVLIFILALFQKSPQPHQITMQATIAPVQKVNAVVEQMVPDALAASAETPQADTSEKSKPQDPVSAPAIITSPVRGLETGFTIQVYSFQDKARAEKALENLRGNGYPQAYIIVSDLGEKGTWYRVRVGGIASEQKAKDTLEQLRKVYNSGFIVKPQK